MNKTTIAIIIAAACIAGSVGGAVATVLISRAPVVQAAAPQLKIAIINLEEASRNSTEFTKSKTEYETRIADIEKESKRKDAELTTLKDRLREFRSTNREDEAADTEVEIKAKEQEIEFANKAYEAYAIALKDKYTKDVLMVVYNKAKDYCTRNGFHILLQDYTLQDTKEDLFAGKMWTQILETKPVVFVDRIDPKDPKPNEYVTDITKLIG